jgi:AraC family transcriptional regulator
VCIEVFQETIALSRYQRALCNFFLPQTTNSYRILPMTRASDHAIAMSTNMHSAFRGAKIYDRLLRNGGGQVLCAVSTRQDAQLRVALYESPPYDLHVPPMGVARLSINLRSAPVSGGLHGDRARDYRGRRYSLFFAPAQSDAHWRKPQPSRHINIYFDEAALDEGDRDRRGALLSEKTLLDVSYPHLKPLIDTLELSMGCDDSFADQASVGIARLLLATLSRRPDRPLPRLPPESVATVRDYVQANLDAPILISDLAALLGLTPNRFALAFTATAGLPPHRFVVECRLKHAMDLLQNTHAGLADIAADCGFSSQQHLTTTMRRLAGTTPGQARRAAKRL